MQVHKSTNVSNLFTPVEVGPLALRNRVVMAPLTRSRAGPGNVPTQLNALYYAQRASAGLIVSEATQISPEGQGYLIDQFLQDRTNQRTDRYGGSIENRTRFLMEVVDAVSAAVGAERTGVRISPQNTMNDIADSDPQTLFNHVAEQLSGRILAYLHVIEGDTGGAHRSDF